MTDKRVKMMRKLKKDRTYYLMFLPVLIFLVLFNYAPMVGIRYSFYEFTPFKKEFIGFENFINLFTGIRATSFWRAFRNTLFLSISNLLLATAISVTIALLINEVRSKGMKKFTQTIMYLPHFLSWIVVASLFTLILSPTQGLVNNLRVEFGLEPIYYLAEQKWWTPVFLFIQRWKETGWGTIIYLAALAGINPQLYEAATIDGANRWQQTMRITLPALSTTILVVFILQLGRVLNMFHSAFALQNDLVLEVSDVLQIFAYRTGIKNGEYGLGTAIGLFKGVVSLILVTVTNKLNKKIRGSSLL